MHSWIAGSVKNALLHNLSRFWPKHYYEIMPLPCPNQRRSALFCSSQTRNESSFLGGHATDATYLLNKIQRFKKLRASSCIGCVLGNTVTCQCFLPVVLFKKESCHKIELVKLPQFMSKSAHALVFCCLFHTQMTLSFSISMGLLHWRERRTD